MKNISNLEISSEKCTKCSSCGKASWYIMECDCRNIFCKNCSAEKEDPDDIDIIVLKCPQCGKTQLYV